jgi:hypothetical protein
MLPHLALHFRWMTSTIRHLFGGKRQQKPALQPEI